MEENNTQNYNEGNQTKVKHYWKECLGMLAASFLGGFLAMYFVADQVFDKHNTAIAYTPDSFEQQMMKDFDKMYERDRKAFEREFDNFNKNFDNDFNKMEKQAKKDLKQFRLSDNWFKNNKKDNKFSKEVYNPWFESDMTMNSVKIKTNIDDDDYKVIVGLNAFNGDDSKINYNVSGRKLTVFGSSIIKDKKFEQEISFSQDFLLPSNADIMNIKKEKDGNNLIIEVPLK